MTALTPFFDMRVARLVIELQELMQYESHLSRTARHSLISACGDVAAALEKTELTGGDRT